jgi:ribosomal protein L44E
MVNFPKKKRTYCKKCVKHTPHAITWQKKAGKVTTVK